jgi:hypothetical protein
MELLSTLDDSFDFPTAKLLMRRVSGSCHDAYVDKDGNCCLVCISKAAGGRVAVGKAGLDWLRGRDGGKFVRLRSANARLNLLVSLDHLPETGWRNGGRGDFMLLGREDFADREFSPPLDDNDVPF